MTNNVVPHVVARYLGTSEERRGDHCTAPFPCPISRQTLPVYPISCKLERADSSADSHGDELWLTMSSITFGRLFTRS